MQCSHCGHENAARDKFCGKCGRPLAQAAQAVPRKKRRNVLALGIAGGAIVILIGLCLVVVLARGPILGLFGWSADDGREGAAAEVPTLTSTPTKEPEPTEVPPTATPVPEPTTPPPTATPTAEPDAEVKEALLGRWMFECDMDSDPNCWADLLIVFTGDEEVFIVEFLDWNDYFVRVYSYSVEGVEITIQMPDEEGGPEVWPVVELDETLLVIEVGDEGETYSLLRDTQQVPDSLQDNILGSWVTTVGGNEIPTIYEFADDERVNVYLVEPEMLLCRGRYSQPSAGTVWMNIACVDSETGEFGDPAMVTYEDGLFINQHQFVLFKPMLEHYIFTQVDDGWQD